MNKGDIWVDSKVIIWIDNMGFRIFFPGFSHLGIQKKYWVNMKHKMEVENLINMVPNFDSDKENVNFEYSVYIV